MPSSSLASARSVRARPVSSERPTPISVSRLIASVVPSPMRLPKPCAEPQLRALRERRHALARARHAAIPARGGSRRGRVLRRSSPPAYASALEAPAGCAVGLRGRDAEDRVGDEAVDVPRRRPGAGSAVRRGERIALDLGRPPALVVDGDERLERGLVGDAGRLALEARGRCPRARGRSCRPGSRRGCATCGSAAAHDEEVAVEPGGADARGVRGARRGGRSRGSSAARCPSGPAARMSRGRLQGSSADPYRSRLVVWVGWVSVMGVRPDRAAELIGEACAPAQPRRRARVALRRWRGARRRARRRRWGRARASRGRRSARRR